MKTTVKSIDGTTVEIQCHGNAVGVGVSMFHKYLDPHAAQVAGFALLRCAIVAQAAGQGRKLSDHEAERELRAFWVEGAV